MLGKTNDQYDGEYFITGIEVKDGRKTETREFIPRTVFNDTHLGHAVCIGNGESRKKFRIELLKGHQGGLLGSKALQTYGCNALSREFKPDFLVVGNQLAEEIAESTEYYEIPYADENIVYCTSSICLKYPGKFNLVPGYIKMDAGSTAVYLACFDKHHTVYMLGYDGQTPGYNNNVYAGSPGYMPHEHDVPDVKWKRNLCRIFGAYPNTQFIWVNDNTHMFPDDYKWYKNVKVINYREFISDADVGSFDHRSK